MIIQTHLRSEPAAFWKWASRPAAWARRRTEVWRITRDMMWDRAWDRACAKVRAVVAAGLTAALWALPLAAVSATAQAQRPAAALPESVRQALVKAGLDESHLAVAVLPLGAAPDGSESRSGNRSHSKATAALLHQADRPMQPASAMKVLTSSVALDRLGPNGRGYTELRTAAPVVDGRLQGDLILRGGADLELGLPQLWALLLELREAGVRHIDGDIVLDRHLFSPARMDVGIPPFDESPEFPYNVIPDALQLAGNLHQLELHSDRQGVSVRLRPELPGVRLDNRLTLHEPGTVNCREWSTRGWLPPVAEVMPDGQIRVELRGRFPVDCQHRQPLQLMERNLQAQAQLRWLWQELGGQWSGRVREAVASTVSPQAAPSRLIARREARPWGEWLRPLNKTSDNVATRMLYLLVGLEEERRAASQGVAAPGRTTREWADASVRRWFTERGIPSEGLVMDNGSGLSRSERITARQLALVLRHANEHLFAPELMMSLPIAGVDGSLRSRMTESPARGRARMKPGTLRNAVALAGYVEDAKGRRWVMAAMVNHDEAPQRGRPVLDALAGWVAAGMP